MLTPCRGGRPENVFDAQHKIRCETINDAHAQLDRDFQPETKSCDAAVAGRNCRTFIRAPSPRHRATRITWHAIQCVPHLPT